VEKFTTQLFYTQSIPMPNPIQGRSDGGGYISIYTLLKSGQVNFYGVEMAS